MQQMKGEKPEKRDLPIISLRTKITSPLQFLIKKENYKQERSSINLKSPSSGEFTQKQKFEYFLTFKKRLSRLFILQALEFMEEVITPAMPEFTASERIREVYRTIMRFYKRAFYPDRLEEGSCKDSKKPSRNKKLDEKFIKSELNALMHLEKYIDEFIKLHLNKKWVISKVDSVLKAGLRVAICEAMLIKKPYDLVSFENNLKTSCIYKLKESEIFKKYFSNFFAPEKVLPYPKDIGEFFKEIQISYSSEHLISRYKLILSEYTTLMKACIEVEKEVDFFNAVLRKALIDIKKIRDKKEDFFYLILANKINESKNEFRINRAV